MIDQLLFYLTSLFAVAVTAADWVAARIDLIVFYFTSLCAAITCAMTALYVNERHDLETPLIERVGVFVICVASFAEAISGWWDDQFVTSIECGLFVGLALFSMAASRDAIEDLIGCARRQWDGRTERRARTHYDHINQRFGKRQ